VQSPAAKRFELNSVSGYVNLQDEMDSSYSTSNADFSVTIIAAQAQIGGLYRELDLRN